MNKPASSQGTTEHEQEIELRDPAIAAFLAWLIPGAGHFYQRRYPKAILFAVCILGTFFYGLYLGSDSEIGWGRVVYISWRPSDSRWNYIAQAFIGAPAFPALIQAARVKGGEAPYLHGLMAPPALGPNEGRTTVDEIHRRLGRYFELGTVYTMIAGLLNVLAIWDAYAGPVFPEPEEEEEDDAEGEKEDADTQAEPEPQEASK